MSRVAESSLFIEVIVALSCLRVTSGLSFPHIDAQERASFSPFFVVVYVSPGPNVQRFPPSDRREHSKNC